MSDVGFGVSESLNGSESGIQATQPSQLSVAMKWQTMNWTVSLESGSNRFEMLQHLHRARLVTMIMFDAHERLQPHISPLPLISIKGYQEAS